MFILQMSTLRWHESNFLIVENKSFQTSPFLTFLPGPLSRWKPEIPDWLCIREGGGGLYLKKTFRELQICTLNFWPFSNLTSFFLDHRSWLANIWKLQYFFTSLLSTCFPEAGFLATLVRADLLLDWSLAANWAQLLITYLAATSSSWKFC